MKLAQILFLTFLASDVTNASVANLVADRALVKISKWINEKGSDWMTLPGQFKKGQVQSYNGKFTLAFTGPQLDTIKTVSRSDEAQLDIGDPDPSYETSQTLHFKTSFENVTVVYDRIFYNENNFGFSNLTSRATSNGVSAEISINLKGHGDSCIAFANSINVAFNGSLWVAVQNVTVHQELTPVVEAVKTHFNANVPKAVGTLLKSAIFESLQYYDVCTNVYYPHTPPNVLADSMLNITSANLRQNISIWATLPAFSKNAIVNDTHLDLIKVGQGNFSSFDYIKRVGVASYENYVNPKFMNFNVTFEVGYLTATYGYIEYIDYNTWFTLSERVVAHKILITVSIQFTRMTANSIPTCSGGSVTVSSKYQKGGLDFKNLTPDVPNYVVRSVNEVLGPGFTETVEGAVNDLFLNATRQTLMSFCS